MGQMDGNERWLPVPVGKADFERSMDRLPGMKLLSCTEKADNKDIIVEASLSFDSMDALLRFLNGLSPVNSPAKAVYSDDNGTARLSLNLGGGGTVSWNPDFKALMETVCKGYAVHVSLTPPNGTPQVHESTLANVIFAGTPMKFDYEWKGR
jgi:hypothetical protein